MSEKTPGEIMRQHTLRAVSLGTLLRMLRLPFVALSMIFIPRAMQQEVYGRFALFLSVYVMADLLTDIGILQIFGRFVPGPDTPETEHRRAFLLQGFLVTGVALTLCSCILIGTYVLLFPLPGFPAEWLLPLCLLLVLTRVEGILFSFLYGMNQIVRYSFREALRSAMLFAGVWVAFLYFGLKGAIWSLVVKEIVLGGVAMSWTRRYLQRPCRLSWSELKGYMVFGVSFFLPMLLFGFLQRSGALFIQAISKSSAEVGYYDIANQFFLLCVGSLGVILITLLPSMSAYRETDSEEIIHRWHAKFMSFCGVAIFLLFNLLAWLGEPALAFSLGPGFLPVRSLALIMSLAMAPGLIAYVGMNYAILGKESRVCSIGVFAGLMAMTITSLLLIPVLGSAGAAWASVVGHTVLALFFCRRYHSHFRFVLKNFAFAILAGIPFIPVLWIRVRWPWAVLLFAGTSAVYVLFVRALGLLDLSIVSAILRKGGADVRGNVRS